MRIKNIKGRVYFRAPEPEQSDYRDIGLLNILEISYFKDWKNGLYIIRKIRGAVNISTP